MEPIYDANGEEIRPGRRVVEANPDPDWDYPDAGTVLAVGVDVIVVGWESGAQSHVNGADVVLA